MNRGAEEDYAVFRHMRPHLAERGRWTVLTVTQSLTEAMMAADAEASMVQLPTAMADESQDRANAESAEQIGEARRSLLDTATTMQRPKV
jgi:hypothetical protein